MQAGPKSSYLKSLTGMSKGQVVMTTGKNGVAMSHLSQRKSQIMSSKKLRDLKDNKYLNQTDKFGEMDSIIDRISVVIDARQQLNQGGEAVNEQILPQTEALYTGAIFVWLPAIDQANIQTKGGYADINENDPDMV